MSNSTSRPRCDTCRFWREIKDDDFGECRKYAPRPIAHPDLPHGARYGEHPGVPTSDPMWLQTYTEDWCGEHEARVMLSERPVVI